MYRKANIFYLFVDMFLFLFFICVFLLSPSYFPKARKAVHSCCCSFLRHELVRTCWVQPSLIHTISSIILLISTVDIDSLRNPVLFLFPSAQELSLIVPNDSWSTRSEPRWFFPRTESVPDDSWRSRSEPRLCRMGGFGQCWFYFKTSKLCLMNHVFVRKD